MSIQPFIQRASMAGRASLPAVDPEKLLCDLRSMPPIGAWAVLDSVWCDDAGEWLPDGCRPSEWHHTRDLAEAGARLRLVPTCIGQVISVGCGWSIGDHIEIASLPDAREALGHVVGDLNGEHGLDWTLCELAGWPDAG